MANVGHRLRDISVPKPNKALTAILVGPGIRMALMDINEKVVERYKGSVAKRTGRLASSAASGVVMGGHKNDRWVGKITVGGPKAVSSWHGQPFYYGTLHEFGSPTKEQFQAALDLHRITRTLKP